MIHPVGMGTTITITITITRTTIRPGIQPVTSGMRLSGGVLPARHTGSVDIFLEAMSAASPGDVLVIDKSRFLFPVSYKLF